MARFVTQSQSDIGLSPFELRFKGTKKSDKILLRMMDFSPGHLDEVKLDSIDGFVSLKDTETVSWLNIDGLHDEALIAALGDRLELDRMIMSDVLNTTMRPHVVEFDNAILISIRMLRFEEKKNRLYTENLSLVLMEHVLVSFQEARGDVFEPVRERIRKQKKKITHSGPDYLAFALLDIVIDNYIYILSVLGERIEQLEDHLISNPGRQTLEQINAFKREMNFLRKSIIPAREMINALSKIDSAFLDSEVMDLHFTELQNNINQAVETSDSYREILSDQLNVYHTTISSKLNDVMKVLTIFSVIFIPLTFIAGIYGTNFDNVPELHYQYSYFIMWGVMLCITIGMIFYFRHKRWL